MKSKLEALVKRIDVLNTELSHEDVTKDMERYKKISKEHSDITPIVEIYKKFQKITLDITDAKELLNDRISSTKATSSGIHHLAILPSR